MSCRASLRAMDLPFTVAADLELGRTTRPWLRDRNADVSIRRGSVPQELQRVEQEVGNWQCAGERVLVRDRHGARALVEAGRSIVYAPAPGADLLDTRLFLTGRPWLALAAQRGLMPLHASAVAVGSDVHAFCGSPGAGKSTLAAALCAIGHEFFADDSLLLDVDPSTDEMRCYAYKDLKLDRTGAELANVPLGSRAGTAAGYGKHYVEMPHSSPQAGGRLQTLSFLASVQSSREAVAPLAGRQAVWALRRSVHRALLVAAIFGRQGLADRMAELAERVELRVFRRSRDKRRFRCGLATFAAALPPPDMRRARRA